MIALRSLYACSVCAVIPLLHLYSSSVLPIVEPNALERRENESFVAALY